LQKNPSLASLRDAQAVRALSAEERQACSSFWADVQALLKQVGGKGLP
jgi:hypothetical protein